MNAPTRFLLYVLILNAIRYLVGVPIEQMMISPMWEVMALYPDCFNASFGANDFAISLIYNFVMWFAAVLVFHVAHPVVNGPIIWRSLKIFGLLLLFYLGLSAVYMNHYTDELKTFYIYSMLDGLIVFSIVAVANGLLYRFFFKPRTAHFEEPGRTSMPETGKKPKFPIPPKKSPPQEPLSHTNSPKPSAPDSDSDESGKDKP